MRLMIAFLTPGQVDPDFACSLANVYAYSMIAGNDTLLMKKQTSRVTRGRQKAAEDAIRLGMDAVLYLDSDMIFPMELAANLIAEDKDIIGCNYAMREEPYAPTAQDFHCHPVEGRSGIDKVARLGAGALLIKVPVFHKLKAPFFFEEWNGKDFTGEDYGFCDKARAAGFDIYCHHDMSVQITHVGKSFHRLKKSDIARVTV